MSIIISDAIVQLIFLIVSVALLITIKPKSRCSNSLPAGKGLDRVRYLEKALAADIGSRRFRPFLTLHEYESLLFSDTEQIGKAFPGQSVTAKLAAIRKAFSSPEDINQGRETHPAARIMNLITGYQKPFHGVLIAGRIGLKTIRKTCPHFNEWVNWLESLSP